MIAAVNGHALGLGLTLALQCDIRLFAADAKYGVVQVRRGVVGDAYSHWVLPRLVGIAKAAEILLTGATFDGRRAVELGLGSRVLDIDAVLPAAVDREARRPHPALTPRRFVCVHRCSPPVLGRRTNMGRGCWALRENSCGPICITRHPPRIEGRRSPSSH